MINFRYHIVSLTAVFLALVIGILMGTTVVSKATVDGLKANVRRAEARSAAVHRTNDELSDELSTRTGIAEDTDEALLTSALTNSVEGLLTEVPVVVITTEHADKDLVRDSVHTLVAAGAHVDGTLVVSDRLLGDGKDADQLREHFELNDGVSVPAAVARQLAGTFVEDAADGATDPTTTTTVVDDADDATTTTTTVPDASGQPDVLAFLLEEGFIRFRAVDGVTPPPQDSDDADGPAPQGHRFVVVGDPEPHDIDTSFIFPLVATMARRGPVAQVVATGPADVLDDSDGDTFLGALLQRDGVDGKLSTDDDLGSYSGYLALVYALVDAADGGFGNYGIGATATAVLPEDVHRIPERSEPTD